MPQLNTTPWFMILAFCWLVLLTLFVPKTLSHIFTNDPASQTTLHPKTGPWLWLWS
uniref:ATP synthase complex subunit 8 n=1 Tax=Neogobius melanostomus TaxID=47308 RepID=A0A1U7AG06_9GOBI|nr:ATP synthase F0 subunit 8 [Neogobius melanostomus]QWE36296.1 ATP synthase F0 subunit 8 [Neogobius melanostomus]QWE37102.1 ATP synthase F0 subunit 8 [Neogobius melanostomus]QWE37259.1 ATP synthase F0 subunit 8 [Neogobius melanostomus]UUK33587.1 ATP synthase F0 subunit 8 [Neogobius melanostomus]